MSHPKLSSPPIIESIFLVRFKESIDREQIEHFCNSGLLSSNYKKRDSDTRGSLYTLGSNEYGKTIRVNLDSLSFHNLTYKPFEEIYTEFAEMIDVMANLNDKLTLELVSVRYVNVIKVSIKEEHFEVSDYINYYVNAPFVVSNYFFQLFVDNEKDKDMEAIIVQTIRSQGTDESDNPFGILLDINVRKKADISIRNQGSLKDIMFQMREFKNYLFFETVKPEIVDTYK